MFRPTKRKSRPISTPATHTFFTSDPPDDCENGITAFAAEFDVSLDETDVYGNLEFKSFLEDAAPIKICDVTSSQLESEDMENSRKEDQEKGSDLHVSQHGNCELKDAGMSQKRSRRMSGDDAEDDGEEVFLQGNSAGPVGSSLLRRKGQAPPPPKRLSSLHPLDEDTCQDVTSDITANQASSLRSRDTETACDRSSDNHDGHGSTLVVSHQALVAELTKRQKTKSDLHNVIEQTDAAEVKANKGSQQDQSALDNERLSLEHLQKNSARTTSTQNATGGDCGAKSDVSGTISAENPAKDVKSSGDVSRAGRPRDIAIGSSSVTKPKATVDKPKIPAKPGHLKSPVAVGLPEIPKVKVDKSSGGVLDVSTPENLLSYTDGRGDGECNTEKIHGSEDQNVCPGSPETEAKCNEVVPDIMTPAKWVLLPKYSTHDDDKSKKRKRILRSGDKNICQKTSVTEAKGNGDVAKTITHDKALLHAQDHTRGEEHNTRTTPEVMSCEDRNIRRRTVGTEARCPESVPEVVKPDKGLLHMEGHSLGHNDGSDKRQWTVDTENQSKSIRPSETTVNPATDPLPLEREYIRCDNGNTDNKQRVILTEDQITSRRTCETSVKTSSRIATVVGSMKCDSDVSSEESVTIVTGAGQPLASTPIPPPRRKKLRNRDRLKGGMSRNTTDSVSASSSMSSEHSVGQGPPKETTSTATAQHGISGGRDMDVPSLLPSPVRMSSQSLDRESDGGIYENVPPPSQFDNSHMSPSTIMGNDRLGSSTAPHPQSNGDQEILSEDLVAFSDRKLGRDDVMSPSGCHPQLVTGDKLRDVSPNRDTTGVPRDSNSRLAKEKQNRNQLNILVEEDYLPGHVSTVPEDLPPHPPQPWEVSMAMSAHLMDLASRPWDDTVVPPISKTSGGGGPTIVDYVWQMKPVELWDTSDVCDWCKTVLDFGALSDAFEECAVSGNQLLQLTRQDLSELGITDALDRNTVLDEIARLQRKQRDSAPFWNLKQISIRRKSLELSNDILKHRLSRLRELNDKQDVQISEYLTELQDEQRRTSQIIIGARSQQVTSSPTPLSSTMRRHRSGRNEMPVMTWSNREVLKWLRHVGLSKFIGTFAEHKIMGTDLAGISMHLLDKMDIMTTDDRELILSELYKLQHPAGPSLEQVIQEQRSWSSEYSDHSSSTPREDLTESVGYPIVRSQPIDMDPEPTDIVMESSVDNGSQDRAKSGSKTSSVDSSQGESSPL